MTPNASKAPEEYEMEERFADAPQTQAVKAPSAHGTNVVVQRRVGQASDASSVSDSDDGPAKVEIGINYHHHREKRPKFPPPWIALGLSVDDGVGRGFGHLGRLIARKPFIMIAICSVIAISLAPGMLMIETESDPMKIWIPQDTIAVQQNDYVTNTFPASPRIETLIATADVTDATMLTPVRLAEFIDVIEQISNVKVGDGSGSHDELGELCMRVNSQCYVISIASVFGTNTTAILEETDASLLAKYKLAVSSGSLSRSDMHSTSGGITKDSNDVIEKVMSLKATWFLDGNSSLSSNAHAWEKEFLKKANSIAASLITDNKKIRIFYTYSNTITDELDRAIGSDLWLMSIAVGLIVLYSSLALGKHDMLRSRVLLAQAGILCVGFAILSSFGLMGYIKYKQVAPNQIIPFIIIGIGVDDMFIIVDAFNRITSKLSHADRLDRALEEVGGSITMTSLTSALAFGVGIVTELPAIRSFCIYALAAVTFNFTYMVTIFPAFLVVDSRRIDAGRLDMFPCKKRPIDVDDASDEHTPHKPQSKAAKEGFLRYFIKHYYLKFLLSTPMKIIVILGFGALTGFAIAGALQLEQKFEVKDLAPLDSYLIPYMDTDDKYYGDYPMAYSIVMRNVDFASPCTAEKITEVEKKTKDYAKSTHQDPISWHSAYKQYVSVVNSALPANMKYSLFNGVPTNSSDFYTLLHAFFNTPQGGFLEGQVVWEDEAAKDDIKACRLSAELAPLKNSTVQVEAMNGIRAAINEVGMNGTFPFSPWFSFFEQFAIIAKEAIQNMLLAGGAVALVTSIFLLHIRAGLIVTLVVAMIDADLLGMMYYLGMSIDSITVTNLVIAIGLSVDYSAHLAHAFQTTSGTKSQRIYRAMVDMGGSVMSGALSTLIGICALGFGSSHIVGIFFKMLLGNVLFGMIHGFILLPVLLSLFGPGMSESRHSAESWDVPRYWSYRYWLCLDKKNTKIQPLDVDAKKDDGHAPQEIGV